jgi:hypothetical protein
LEADDTNNHNKNNNNIGDDDDFLSSSANNSFRRRRIHMNSSVQLAPGSERFQFYDSKEELTETRTMRFEEKNNNNYNNSNSGDFMRTSSESKRSDYEARYSYRPSGNTNDSNFFTCFEQKEQRP